jgi:hypothetical protein
MPLDVSFKRKKILFANKKYEKIKYLLIVQQMNIIVREAFAKGALLGRRTLQHGT